MADEQVAEYQPMELGELLGQPAPKEEVAPSQASEKPEEEAKPEEVKEKPEEKVAEEVKEEKKPPEEKAEVKPSIDWEAEDNPFKSRYFNTQQWATTVNQENANLKKGLEIAQKKLDGTYVEGEEFADAETLQRENDAEFKGSLTASHKVAGEIYGQDYVYKMLYAPDAPFQQINNDPAVHYRVLHSEAPAQEAIKILKEFNFFNKYGRDVDKIESTIREKLKAEVKEEVTKEFKEKLKLKEKQPDGLGNVVDEQIPFKEKQGYQPKTTKELFS